ncbi:MAG TPA: dihydrodipicolinate synthase family protein [Ilumatobacteraceae bacterium]|nr:dihydrodipicolinate synthase family protein [Ilumatobacteraceae bacterium]
MSDLKLEGVYVPVVTPFDADEGLDLSTLTKVIDYCLDAGVRGVVSCGTTGEYYAMSSDERERVMAHTREVVGSRAQLVAGCNAGSTREAIHLAEAAVGMGYDAIMLAAPPTSLPTQRELAAHYKAIADAVDQPVVLYNYPARAGVEIGFECLDAVADHPNIIAIKESSGDFSRFLQLRRRYAGRLDIMCGSDDQAADYFSWGVRSWLAGTANVLPRHHVIIMNTANEGKHGEAIEQFAAILPWIQNMESGSYNAKAKLGLAHLGIDCGPVRTPLLSLTDDVAAELLGVLDQALAAPYAKS